MCAFTTGNYLRQPVAVYLFVKCVNLYFMLEFKSDVIKDVNFTKIYHLFAAVEGVHSIITFALREGGGFLKMRTKVNGGEGGVPA